MGQVRAVRTGSGWPRASPLCWAESGVGVGRAGAGAVSAGPCQYQGTGASGSGTQKEPLPPGLPRKVGQAGVGAGAASCCCRGRAADWPIAAP